MGEPKLFSHFFWGLNHPAYTGLRLYTYINIDMSRLESQMFK